MLHYFIAILILVHGLIHLMGFAHHLDFTEDDNLHLPDDADIKLASPVVDDLWIVTYALFVATAVLFFLYQPYWWITALTGIFLSQILILLNWKDAKFGTISNLIVLFTIALVMNGQVS